MSEKENLIPGAKISVFWKLTFNVTLSSFLFGYQIGAFNITINPVSDTLGWDGSILLVTISSTAMPIGAFIGSFTGGLLSNSMGRRKFLIFANLIATIAAVINCIPTTYTFIIGRLASGFVGGASASVCPIYIAEFAPLNLRGRLGAMFQFQCTFGILIAYILSLPCLYFTPWWWIAVMAFPVVIAIIQTTIFTTTYRYEPPVYLYLRDREDDARKALAVVYDEDYIDQEMSRIKAENSKDTDLDGSAVHDEEVGYKDVLCKRKYRKEMFIGNLLSFFQQTTGINAIMFYSTALFVTAGAGSIAAELTVVVGAINMGSTLLGMPFVDKYGRRILLIVGYIGMFVAEVLVGILALIGQAMYIQIAFIFVFIIFFELSVGPLMWLYAGEIMNDKGMGVASMVNWTVVIIVSAVSYFMFNTLKIGPTLLMYGAFSFMGLIFVLIWVFETKGLTKEEIQAKLRSK